jgi:hypothetical protein
MNYQLTDTQQKAVELIAKSELRPIEHIVSMLFIEGIRFGYQTEYQPYFGECSETAKFEDKLQEEIAQQVLPPQTTES